MTTLSNQSRLSNLIHRAIESPGQPLEPAIRSFMETALPQQISRISPCCVKVMVQFPQFVLTSPQDEYELEAERIADELTAVAERSISAGYCIRPHDLSRVRVHTDKQAAKSAHALNADAFTCGNHIVFGSGKYAPDTTAGLRLLAHELTHVLQQQGRRIRFVQRAETDTEASLRGGARLTDSAPDVNKRIELALNNARKTAGGNAEKVISGLYEELGVNGSVGRTRIEDWAETLGKKKVHLPPQKITKYAGVRYRLWLQANMRGIPVPGLPMQVSGFPILNPTMLINGIYVGSDKLGHFLQQGYQYYQIAKSKGAAGKKMAERMGIQSEKEGFGLQTTGVMSHADLEANRQGMRFYQELAADANLKFDIAHYINKNWNEGQNPNYYEESVGKYVWTNLLSARQWKGTIRDQNHSTDVTAKFNVSNDIKLEGQFSFIQKIGGKTTGQIINGKVTHLKNVDNAIRGVRIDFEWQLKQSAGTKGKSSGKGFWESAGETILKGKWGWGKKNDNRGVWTLAQ